MRPDRDADRLGGPWPGGGAWTWNRARARRPPGPVTTTSYTPGGIRRGEELVPLVDRVVEGALQVHHRPDTGGDPPRPARVTVTRLSGTQPVPWIRKTVAGSPMGWSISICGEPDGRGGEHRRRRPRRRAQRCRGGRGGAGPVPRACQRGAHDGPGRDQRRGGGHGRHDQGEAAPVPRRRGGGRVCPRSARGARARGERAPGGGRRRQRRLRAERRLVSVACRCCRWWPQRRRWWCPRRAAAVLAVGAAAVVSAHRRRPGRGRPAGGRAGIR